MILVQEKIKTVVKGNQYILPTRPYFWSFVLSSLPKTQQSETAEKNEDAQLKRHVFKKYKSCLEEKIEKNRKSGKLNENLKKGQIKPLKPQRATCWNNKYES